MGSSKSIMRSARYPLKYLHSISFQYVSRRWSPTYFGEEFCTLEQNPKWMKENNPLYDFKVNVVWCISPALLVLVKLCDEDGEIDARYRRGGWLSYSPLAFVIKHKADASIVPVQCLLTSSCLSCLLLLLLRMPACLLTVLFRFEIPEKALAYRETGP